MRMFSCEYMTPFWWDFSVGLTMHKERLHEPWRESQMRLKRWPCIRIYFVHNPIWLAVSCAAHYFVFSSDAFVVWVTKQRKVTQTGEIETCNKVSFAQRVKQSRIHLRWTKIHLSGEFIFIAFPPFEIVDGNNDVTALPIRCWVNKAHIARVTTIQTDVDRRVIV